MRPLKATLAIVIAFLTLCSIPTSRAQCPPGYTALTWSFYIDTCLFKADYCIHDTTDALGNQTVSINLLDVYMSSGHCDSVQLPEMIDSAESTLYRYYVLVYGINTPCSQPGFPSNTVTIFEVSRATCWTPFPHPPEGTVTYGGCLDDATCLRTITGCWDNTTGTFSVSSDVTTAVGTPDCLPFTSNGTMQQGSCFLIDCGGTH